MQSSPQRGDVNYSHPSYFGLLAANARVGQLEDHGVMDQPVDYGDRRRRVLENSIPFAEQQLAGDDRVSAPLALGERSIRDLARYGSAARGRHRHAGRWQSSRPTKD